MKIPVTDRALTPNTSLVHFRRAIVFGEAQECKDICRTIERTFAAYFGAENYEKYKAISRANAVNPSEKKSRGFSTAIHATTTLTKGAQVTESSAAMPSPLFHPPTIESSATTVSIVCPEARRSSGVDPSRGPEKSDVGGTFQTLTSLQEDLEKDKAIDFDPAFDVIVVIARVNDSYAMNRAAAFAKYHSEKNNNSNGKAGAATAPSVVGKMLIVTNAVSKEHVLASVAPLNNPPSASSRKWLTSIAVSEHLAPPSFYPEEVPEFTTRLRGPLENICLGVALGVSRHLSVNASTYVAVASLDLVFAVSFTALSLSLARRIPHGASPSPNRLLVEIGNPNEGLVWGMVGEYAIDYYGRYQQAIGRVMPNLFTDDPTINFHIHFHDVWNYGIHLMHPVTLYRARLGTNTRNQLANMENHTTLTNTPGASQKMRDVLNKIDDVEDELAIANPVQRLNAASVEAVKKSAEISFKTIKNVVMASQNKGKSRSPSPNNRKRNSNNADDALLASSSSSSGDFRLYNFIVSMITSDAHLAPLLPFVSVGWVKWERYMKSICVGVLAFSGRHILSMPAEAVNKLPNPTMMFHNDFAFCGEERAPEPNMRLRQFFPDLFWVLRSGQQPSGQQVAVAPGKRRLVAILAQPQVQLMMSQIAKEQNINKHQVEQRAERILRQVGDNLNQTDMRLAGAVVRKVFQALYERININSDAYDVLFKAFRKPRTCVVVIPAHRSYIDFMFLGYMLLTFGFQPPHAASGEDFLRLGPLANLLRGSGAFFMRRTFRGDRLYSGLFKEYVRHLVRDAQCIEFFIEGLRSRTGKTIAPKVGFLKMITDAFFEKQEEVDDVLFVPISLSYDKLLEGNIYANELMGIPKPKETMGNLIKSASVLKDKYGALNIVVGEPISLVEMNKDPFATPDGYAPIPKNERVALKVPNRPPSAAPPSPASGMGLSATGSVAGPSGSNTPARVLASLAWRITYDIQQRLVVTPTAIISAVLMSMVDHTRLRVSGAPLSMVSNYVEWLRTKVLHKGGNMDSRFAGREASELVTYAIDLLSPSVTLSSLSTVYVEDTVTTKMLLSMYANQLIHVFADEAILCVCAFAFGREQMLEAPESVTSVGNATNGSIQGNAAELGTSDYCIPLGELRKRARRLQNLMSNELPNFQAASPVWFESWLNVTLEALVEDGAVAHLPLSDADDEEVRFRLCQLSSFSAHQLYQYIESFFITLASALVFIPTPAAVVIASGGSVTPPPQQPATPASATEVTTAATTFPIEHTSASANSVATTKIQDAQLQRLAHEGSLELFRKKMTDYAQCSSKENIKNCVAKIEEFGLFTRDVSPAVTFIVRKSHYDDLRVCLEEVNAMRWHPSGPADLERIVSELKHVYVTKVAISNTKL